jgi:hypothetical protein
VHDRIDYLALTLNGILVFIGFGGVWYARKTLNAIQGQLDEIRTAARQTDRMVEHAGKQADAATDAAKAARLNAEAVMNAENALLLIRPEDRIQYGDWWSFDWKVYNSGNTPAFIIEVAFKFQFFDSMDAISKTPTYPEAFPWNDAPVLPKEVRAGDGVGLSPKMPVEEVSNRVGPGKAVLFAYGRVKYRDIFRREHETRFGLIYFTDIGRFGVGGPPEYNKYT